MNVCIYTIYIYKKQSAGGRNSAGALSILSTFQGVFQGVSVTVHETSGVENPDAILDPGFEKTLCALLRGSKGDVVIYCLQATEMRMCSSLINSKSTQAWGLTGGLFTLIP